MPSDFFRFKQFVLYQQHCAMKVGTDGVLLGAWADVSDSNQIIDIGTGTGLVALMLAQRNHVADITAIEIDQQAAQQATDNVQQSLWKNRLHVINTSLQEFVQKAPSQRFDVVVCNPPFFVNALKTPDEIRNIARHNDTLPFDVLTSCVKQLLQPNGKFCVILPTENETAFTTLMLPLQIERRTWVFTKQGKKAKRVLLQFAITSQLLQSDDLYIYDIQNQYTEQYTNLTKDFYVFF